MWIPKENRNVSPDIYLQILNTKYAVEITSILEKVKLGNRVIDHIEIDKSVMEFVENIKEEAIKEGVLQGAYTIFYKPIEKIGKNKWVIAARIWDYLLRTKNMSSAPQEYVFGEGHNGWYILKHHSNKNYLSRTTGDAKWKGESVNELCDLLNKTLERKVKVLRLISLPQILLVLDRFAWIDAKNWIQYRERLINLDKFHTIFLVSDKSGNSILHSVEKSWLNIKVS